MAGSEREYTSCSKKVERSEELAMAKYKRGDLWWADFTVNGVRYRVPLDTTDWREAKKKESEKIAEAETGKLTATSQKFARLAFSEAADRYIGDRLALLATGSIATEKERLKPLKNFFAATPLTRIS